MTHSLPCGAVRLLSEADTSAGDREGCRGNDTGKEEEEEEAARVRDQHLEDRMSDPSLYPGGMTSSMTTSDQTSIIS